MSIQADFETDMVFSQDVTLSTVLEEIYDASSSELLYTKISYVHTPFYLWLIFWVISIFIIGRLFLEFIIFMRRK